MELNRNTLLIFIAAMALLVVLAWKVGSSLMPGQPPVQINGTIFAEPRNLEPFALTQTEEKTFSNKDLHGHWSFLYFGYTHCPDACPTTMLQFKQLQEKLRTTAANIKVSFVMVTVDPERDTPQIMQQYVNHFSSSFLGLGGEPGQIKAFAKQLFMGYQRGEDNTAIGYTMYHSDSIAIINPEGQFAAVLSSPHRVKNMAQDFLKVTSR